MSIVLSKFFKVFILVVVITLFIKKKHIGYTKKKRENIKLQSELAQLEKGFRRIKWRILAR